MEKTGVVLKQYLRAFIKYQQNSWITGLAEYAIGAVSLVVIQSMWRSSHTMVVLWIYLS